MASLGNKLIILDWLCLLVLTFCIVSLIRILVKSHIVTSLVIFVVYEDD